MPSRHPPRNLVIVICLAAALYLVGNASVSLWDRDEPRYVQTSRQMLDSDDWVVPRFLDEVRTAKPVFIYWCQAASMSVLGKDGDAGVFAARLPSVIAMTLLLILLGVAGRCAGDADRAFWAVLVMATSILTLWSAKSALTDAMLLLGITVAQLCLYRIWRGRATWSAVVAMAVAIGVAGLTKGPVVLGVMGMTLLALGLLRVIDRSRRLSPSPGTPGEGWGEGLDALPAKAEDPHPSPLPEYRERRPDGEREPGSVFFIGAVLRVIVALAIITAIVAPWLYLVSQRESAFLGTSVSHDVLSRIAKPLEGHKGPPGYHLGLVFATFLPWSLLLPLAIVTAWKNRGNPQIRFALAAVVGPWVMFEIVQTKLPHYMLPTFPALAFLTADAIVRCLRGELDDLKRKPAIIGAAIVGTVIVLIGVGTIALAIRFHDPLWPAIVLTAVAIGFCAFVVRLFAYRRPRSALLAMGIGMACFYVALFAVYLPRADAIRVSNRVAEILVREGATKPGEVQMLDYKEPSLAYYQGGTIRENSMMAVSHEMLDSPAAWWVITDEVWKRTPADVQDSLDIVGAASGVAYADGRVAHVMIVRKRPAGISQ